MNARLNIAKAAPDAYAAVSALDHHIVHDSGLEPRLVHLIKIRASQINGCAYCVDMHVKEARRDGLGEQWMHLISVWHEARVFTTEERAVLAWTDSLTRLPETGAADTDFEPLRQHFSDEQIAKITIAIGTINVWNRIAVGSRLQHPVDRSPQTA